MDPLIRLFSLILISILVLFVSPIILSNFITKRYKLFSQKIIAVLLLDGLLCAAITLFAIWSATEKENTNGEFLYGSIPLVFPIFFIIGFFISLKNRKYNFPGNPNVYILILLFSAIVLIYYNPFILYLADISNNLNLCSAFIITSSDNFSTNCIGRIAINTQNIDLCNKISPDRVGMIGIFERYILPRTQMECRYRVAVKSSGITNCEQFNIERYAAECINAIVDNIGNSADCGSLSDTGTKDTCFLRQAANTGDSIKCNLITGGEKKRDCLITTNGLPASQLLLLCENNTTDRGLMNNCMHSVEFNDATACSSLVTNRGKVECYTVLAQESRDDKVCDLIQEDDSRFYCIAQGARSRGRRENQNFCRRALSDEAIIQRGLSSSTYSVKGYCRD